MMRRIRVGVFAAAAGLTPTLARSAPTPPNPSPNSSAAPTSATHTAYVHPRLVLSGGPVVGPSAVGSEECRQDGGGEVCDRAGAIVGLGANLELRARIWRPLYVHARGLFTGNVVQRKPLYDGLLAAGIGFGAYFRRAFIRGEFLPVFPLGDDTFAPPFGTRLTSRDTWNPFAGLVSAGARFPFTTRMGGELWGGVMIGPHSRRVIRDEVQHRTIVTFVGGFNLHYDLVR